jgi:hypothetical protein
MMKTITTNVFTLSELSPAAKERAREWYRRGLNEGLWDGDMVIEDAKECLALAGFNVDKVYYSGFSSQGDGACFEGGWDAQSVKADEMKAHAPKNTELHRIANECARIAALFPFASLSVKHSGRYYHKYCTDFTISLIDASGDEIDTPAACDAEKALIEVSRDAMQWIYRQLERDWEWANADEQVDESIAINEYTFTEDGKRFG